MTKKKFNVQVFRNKKYRYKKIAEGMKLWQIWVTAEERELVKKFLDDVRSGNTEREFSIMVSSK